MPTDAQMETLRILVIRMRLGPLLRAVAEVARENAREIEWEDKLKARQWERAAKAVDKCSTSPAISLIG